MRVAAVLLASCLWPSMASTAPEGERQAAAPSIPATTTWISRHGSVMVLDLGQDGRLQGYFVNSAPGKGCRGIPYDLNGQLLGETIVFRVNWRNGVADCMTKTEWRGHLRPAPDGGMQIVSEWQRTPVITSVGLADEGPSKGADLFTQQVIPEWRSSLNP